MNGFTSGILTMLLSWLRSLVNNLWLLLGSEGGGSFVSFLRANWKTIFLAICIGGFALDRIIYLIRWRPYYVWGTRLARLRSRRGRDQEAPNIPAAPRARSALFAQNPIPPSPPQAPLPQETFDSPTTVLDAAAPQDDWDGHTPGFAPLASARDYSVAADATISYPYVSGNTEPAIEPAFDGDSVAWTSPAPESNASPYPNDLLRSQEPMQEPFENPALHLAPAFGAAKTEPAQYLMDVQAGFAPPPAPEKLYPKPSSVVRSEPVHPGLDSETFQQNIGLAPGEVSANRSTESLLKPAVDFPDTTFVSYYQHGGQATSQRPKRPLADFAKKARSLVSIHDEANAPTIRDLQPPQAIKDAFHAPVFPRKADESGEES